MNPSLRSSRRARVVAIGVSLGVLIAAFAADKTIVDESSVRAAVAEVTAE